MNNQITGLTKHQFIYLKENYSNQGFVPESTRINNYSNPAHNTADRNWQELLRKDPGYSWSTSDRKSYAKNCNFGPHNASSQLDEILFSKK
jgi:hypothetical protein